MSGKRRVNSKGRNTGTIAPGKWFALHRIITESEAWRALHPAAWGVYIEIRSRHDSRTYRDNNGRIPFSCDEGALLLHMSKATVWRALKQLEDHGFIECIQKGCLGSGRASEFRITSLPVIEQIVDGEILKGQSATNEFRGWENSRSKKQNPSTEVKRHRYRDETVTPFPGTEVKRTGTEVKR